MKTGFTWPGCRRCRARTQHPAGNALTVATTLVDVQDGIRKEDATGRLRHSTLLNALERTQAGFDILIRNLDRAANIVQNFKQVAVDQTNDQRRTFDAAHVVQEVLTLLSPGLRKANCTVDATPLRAELRQLPRSIWPGTEQSGDECRRAWS
ncbi:MAG: hypothetical protein IPH35_22975 [Rhodoferax sp.]|nr:hypothetical protein [Rhodoferax sp.]